MKKSFRKKVAVFALVVSLSAAADVFAQSSKPVVLKRTGEAIQELLPSAANYFVKKVVLNQHNKALIKAQGNFSPQVPYVKFFYGEDASGNLVGTVLFNQMTTSHGLIEVAIAMTPAGEVSNVVVTRVAKGMEQAVKTVISAGVMKAFVGLSPQSMSDPMTNVSESDLGAVAYHVAQVIATAVIRGAVYYNILFQRPAAG